MKRISDWRGNVIDVAESTGGVLAAVDPWSNVVRLSDSPWPPPELIQKLYQSRQVRAFRESNLTAATQHHGFYSDLQSIHSEDAITWSVFGPIAYCEEDVRGEFVRTLFELISIPVKELRRTTVWLWRRLPHPDSLVPGGPEIDFGIQTADVFLLGEAKWLSALGTRQGVEGQKTQLTLRQEFCEKYGRAILPSCKHFVILGVSLEGGIIPVIDTASEGVQISTRDTTWEVLASIEAHPNAAELHDYIAWKRAHSRTV